MNERELKWVDDDCGDPCLIADDMLAWDWSNQVAQVNVGGWCFESGEVVKEGPETGAAGRRAAERALVDAGVISQAEADGLIGEDINEQPDDTLPASVGMTPAEFGAWVVRNFDCSECCDSGCSECKGSMFPPPGYSARDCEACDFRMWIKHGDTMCSGCNEWGDELIATDMPAPIVAVEKAND